MCARRSEESSPRIESHSKGVYCTLVPPLERLPDARQSFAAPPLSLPASPDWRSRNPTARTWSAGKGSRRIAPVTWRFPWPAFLSSERSNATPIDLVRSGSAAQAVRIPVGKQHDVARRQVDIRLAIQTDASRSIDDEVIDQPWRRPSGDRTWRSLHQR